MIVEGGSVAECWLKILTKFVIDRKKEFSPIVVSISNSNVSPDYRAELEQDINSYLNRVGQPLIETTAGTIFPISLTGGKVSIYDRYEKIWPYIQRDPRNRRGTYFRRLSAYGEKYGRRVNQLEEIVNTYNGIESVRNPVRRRSAFIATTFDSTLDHKPTPYLGFPCLQQICFIPNSNMLCMNAIYAMQHLDNRAYGNYLGLVRLGEFVAGEMGLQLHQVNVMISILRLEKMAKKEAAMIVKKYGQ